jgi:hypothetical protein
MPRVWRLAGEGARAQPRGVAAGLRARRAAGGAALAEAAHAEKDHEVDGAGCDAASAVLRCR